MTKLIAYSLLLTALVVSGCVARVTPYETDRVDQELSGNRGIVGGKVSDMPEVKRKKTKEMYNLEIELPSKGDKRSDVASKGNKGYLVGKEIPRETTVPAKKKTGRKRLLPFTRSSKPQVVYQPSAISGNKYEKEKGSGTIAEGKVETGERIYTVEKGDTLQKISEKAYGTTKKWKKIFEANRNILESPDKIKPGQELVIPE